MSKLSDRHHQGSNGASLHGADAKCKPSGQVRSIFINVALLLSDNQSRAVRLYIIVKIVYVRVCYAWCR